MGPGRGVMLRCGGDAKEEPLTVDGDGDGLGEGVAIATDEGRNLAELVVLQELLRGVGSVDLDSLKLETVGLCNREDGRGAGVELRDKLAVSSLAGYQTSDAYRIRNTQYAKKRQRCLPPG